MTVLLTGVNRFAAHNQSTQPVDNSGEKFGATGGQPGPRGGELKNKRRIGRARSQPNNIGRAATHIPCGRPNRRWPGLTVVLPIIHRAYCDYVLFFSQKLNNQQLVSAQPRLARLNGQSTASWAGARRRSMYPVQPSLHITNA